MIAKAWLDLHLPLAMGCDTYRVVMGLSGDTDPALRMIRRLFSGKAMGGRFGSRDFAAATYRKYCRAVMESVPPERLLA